MKNHRKTCLLAAGLVLGAVVPAFVAAEVEVAVEAVDEAADAVPADPYAGGADAEGFASLESRVCYAIGMNIGQGMAEQFEQGGMTFDADSFVEAFRGASTGVDMKLTPAQIDSTLQAFQQEMQARMIAKMQKQAEENTAAGAAFLEANALVEGVQVTESGLQYSIEKLGDGATPGPGDTVLIHYEGTLLDGTVFDSSIARGEPVPFPMDVVLPSFSEGLALMPVGTEGMLFIPGELGYGMNPRPGSGIGFNETLTFKVRVLEILPAPAPGSQDPGSIPGVEVPVIEGELESLPASE